jgi:uncharacterized membrane protein
MAPSPPPASPSVPQAASPDERIFAAVAYLAFLFVVTLVAKPKSEFCKFHARQSMILFLITIIVLVVLAIIPWFGSLLTLALFALYVLSMYRAYQGEMWKIPIIGDVASAINIDEIFGKAGLVREKAEHIAQQASEKMKEPKS